MICPFCQSRRATLLAPVKRTTAPVTPVCAVCIRLSPAALRTQLALRGWVSVEGVMVKRARCYRV